MRRVAARLSKNCADVIRDGLINHIEANELKFKHEDTERGPAKRGRPSTHVVQGRAIPKMSTELKVALQHDDHETVTPPEVVIYKVFAQQALTATSRKTLDAIAMACVRAIGTERPFTRPKEKFIRAVLEDYVREARKAPPIIPAPREPSPIPSLQQLPRSKGALFGRDLDEVPAAGDVSVEVTPNEATDARNR
jgi:hypothetical protein